jgi:hypothetical protein
MPAAGPRDGGALAAAARAGAKEAIDDLRAYRGSVHFSRAGTPETRKKRFLDETKLAGRCSCAQAAASDDQQHKILANLTLIRQRRHRWASDPGPVMRRAPDWK